MNFINSLIIFIGIFNWIISYFLTKKLQDFLYGKDWIIGILGLIKFILVSWIIAISTNYLGVIIYTIVYLPWYLHYVYFLYRKRFVSITENQILQIRLDKQ